MPLLDISHPMEKKLLQLKYYCDQGFPIFPVHWMTNGQCACGLPDCSSPGKHPLVKGGFKAASNDFDQIKAWYEHWPQANWGMRTGDSNTGGADILVVDIDSDSGGFETWDYLRIDHSEPMETVTVTTGGGGQHLWFKYPSGADIRSSAAVLGNGIDIRANNGYVLVPPSRTTQEYCFDLHPDDTPIDGCPEWIMSMLHQSLPEVHPPLNTRGRLEIPQGERHLALLRMAGKMWRVGMSRSEIEDAMKVYRDARFIEGDHPVTDDEIIAIANWISEKSREYALTDLGNAERFVDQHQQDVRFCYEWKKWLVWDGRFWVIDDQASLKRRAHTTVRWIYREATDTLDENKRKAIAKHASRSEATSRIESLLESSKPYLVVHPNELDHHPMYLNVATGVIDLSTGELLPHDPDQLLTKFIDVEYQTTATCPEWEKFLDLVTGGDLDLQLFLQIAVGYTLTGRTDEHALFFLYGVGQNGKTTFTETIRRLLANYSRRVETEALLQSFNHGHAATPYIAGMAGARFVIASETPDNRKLNESLVKDLTGGDIISARYLHANPFTYTPTFKLWMFGNYKPRISGTDEGIWRRIRVIPFRVTIPNDLKRPMSEIIATFEAEMPGILAWAVKGCLIWQAHGLETAEAVKEATLDYRTEQDVVQQFLQEKCEMQADFSVEKDALYSTWGAWCESEGEKDAQKRSKNWLTSQLTSRGFEHSGGGKRKLRGLRLKK